MTERQRYQRLHEIFAAVAERAKHERATELDRLCGEDVALRQQVEELLTFHDREDGPLTSPLVPPAAAQITIDRVSESVGDQIGRYRLLQQIGEGGFGVVYMAEQKEPVRRKVALKVIKLGMDTKQVIARFEAERQALAMMDHPNIAKVLDAGATESGRPYFVMELVKGDPVTEYCDRRNLGTRERLQIVRQVCQAVQHAHQKGVIHRDLKPGNVLVTVADGRPVPKVIDFGIAKATNRELTDKTLFTEFRQLVGTPEYMSPEQAETTGVDIDTRSDVYALGVLLYELLTGTTPFDSRTLRRAAYGEIQRIIREEEPPKPSTRLHALLTSGPVEDGDEHSSIQHIARHRAAEPAALSRLMRGDLDWIVMKCLEKDRARRYETANGLASDIQRHLDDQPVSAGPPTAAYRMRKFVRRNRPGVAMAGIVGAALILGMVGTTWQAVRATKAETAATRELARAEEVKRIITEMLSSIEPEEAQGADVTLLQGILDDTARRLADGEVADERIAAELRAIIGTTYAKLGVYEEAERHLSWAAETRTRLLGAEHMSTLGTMSNLASVYTDQGRYLESESLRVETLAIQRRVLGEEHPDTLVSMNNLAAVHKKQGRYAEAESLFVETLAIQRRVLGEEHPDTLVSMNNLAAVHKNQGRYDEAESLHLEKLAISRRVLGEEHPDTLYSMNNLAIAYREQGRYADAESLHIETLEIRRRVLGEEHPHTLTSMHGLAIVYGKQGRYDEAESLHVETLAIRRRVLGEEHPSTIASAISLAVVYKNQGRYDEAESLHRETLTIQRRVLGEEHPHTLMSMNNLANVHKNQGRYDEAESLHIETLEIRRRALGEEHPDTLMSMYNLANVYKNRGRHDEAESLHLETLEIRRRVLGEENPSTIASMNNLAILYAMQGRYTDAEPLFLQSLAIRRRLLGDEHRRTLGAMDNLVLLYSRMEDHEKSRAMLETTLHVKRRVLGMQHPSTRSDMEELASTYTRLGRHDDALPLQRELLELRGAAAEKPGANAETLNGAAWDLLTHDVESLRDPHRALIFARAACNPEDAAPAHMLDTLGLALFETGDVAGAVETARRALELIPVDAADRQAYIDQLRKYEAALGEDG